MIINMNFGLGFLLGSMLFRRPIKTSPEPLKPSKKTIDRQSKIIPYLQNHPYSTCGEVAKGIDEEHRLVSGSLIAMWLRNDIYRIEDENTGRYKYFTFTERK